MSRKDLQEGPKKKGKPELGLPFYTNIGSCPFSF